MQRRTLWRCSFAAPDGKACEWLDALALVVQQDGWQVGIWIPCDALCRHDLEEACLRVLRCELSQALCQHHAAFVTAPQRSKSCTSHDAKAWQDEVKSCGVVPQLYTLRMRRPGHDGHSEQKLARHNETTLGAAQQASFSMALVSSPTDA